jgi:hypothetical protein
MTMMNARSLTSGEIALAWSIFGEAIDYARVRLIKGKWWPFHPPGMAMAPMGDIYFHPRRGGWSDDFASEPLGRQAFFIHEMTHVWQAQTKGHFYLMLMRHPFCRYGYALEPDKPFNRYGIEQQAEIVAHRFLADRGATVASPPPRELLPFA